MKNLYKLMALFCGAMLSLPVLAQSDYRPGFVVMPQGDTLRGQVSYRPDVVSGSTIGFKRNGQTETATYTADNIAGYGFPGDRNYRTRVLDHADTLAAEYVFMEELVRGNMSLYLYKSTFFVEKKDNPDKLHKLYITNEEYYNKDKVLARRQVNHHVTTLNMLMQDCIAMFQKVERVKLAEKNLVELVQEYNQCVSGSEQTTFKEDKPWFALRPGFVGAMSHTSLNFSAKDERYLHMEHAEFNTNTYPSFGIALLINSPRINEKTSLLVEGRYFQNNFQADPSYMWFGSYYDNEIEIDLSAIKITTALRYDFSGKTLQPFVNVGAFMNLFQTRDYKHTQNFRRTQSSEPVPRNTQDGSDFISNNQQGLMVGAGSYLNINKHRLSLEARYELGLDLHEQNAINRINSGLDSDTRTVSLLFGFYF